MKKVHFLLFVGVAFAMNGCVSGLAGTSGGNSGGYCERSVSLDCVQNYNYGNYGDAGLASRISAVCNSLTAKQRAVSNRTAYFASNCSYANRAKYGGYSNMAASRSSSGADIDVATAAANTKEAVSAGREVVDFFRQIKNVFN